MGDLFYTKTMGQLSLHQRVEQRLSDGNRGKSAEVGDVLATVPRLQHAIFERVRLPC